MFFMGLCFCDGFKLYFVGKLIWSLLGFCIGFILAFKPHIAIEIQRRFYEKINWKIEPISMEKELRNTQIMGIFVIVAAVLTILYAIIKAI